MTKIQKEKVRQIKHECNHPKSELMKLSNELEETSPRQARQLNKIIARLEVWQNK